MLPYLDSRRPIWEVLWGKHLQHLKLVIVKIFCDHCFIIQSTLLLLLLLLLLSNVLFDYHWAAVTHEFPPWGSITYYLILSYRTGRRGESVVSEESRGLRGMLKVRAAVKCVVLYSGPWHQTAGCQSGEKVSLQLQSERPADFLLCAIEIPCWGKDGTSAFKHVGDVCTTAGNDLILYFLPVRGCIQWCLVSHYRVIYRAWELKALQLKKAHANRQNTTRSWKLHQFNI